MKLDTPLTSSSDLLLFTISTMYIMYNRSKTVPV